MCMLRDIGYLVDMLHEARMALTFAARKSFADFEEDAECQYAVIRAIEVLGEAAARGPTSSETPIRRFRGGGSSECGIG